MKGSASLGRSFRNASRGVWALIRTERNARIHLAATALVVASGIVLGVSRAEWAVLGLAIALVWSAEAMNTAVEALGDAVSPEPNEAIGKAKDVAAGAVLLATIGAVVVGLLVFGPRLVEVLTHPR